MLRSKAERSNECLPGEVPLDLEFLLEVGLELIVDVVDDRLEAVLLVDLVAVPHSLAQGQLQSNENLQLSLSISRRNRTHVEPDAALLQLVSPRLELDVQGLVVCRHGLEGCVEEGVHERGLAEPGLANAHHVEGEPSAHRLVYLSPRERMKL